MRTINKVRSLPLGLDIGSTRIRMAAAARSAAEGPRIVAVATRDLSADDPTQEPEFFATLLDEMHAELGTRERRCVFTLPPLVAAVRYVTLPPMSAPERLRAARFEASRFVSWADPDDCAIRIQVVEPQSGLWAIGVARKQVLASRALLLRRAGLKPWAADDTACALLRAFEFADAVIDVGLERSWLHVATSVGPISIAIPTGGQSITEAIARELSIDSESAERRKRILGIAGSGDSARETQASVIAQTVRSAREKAPIRRVSLVGNGARLNGLAEHLESTIDGIVEIIAPDVLVDGSYPADVVRAAAPDWALAASLASWAVA